MTVPAHSNLTIGNVHIRQDEAGRYCLNDLHKAAGGEKRHLPSRWLENQQTQDLIAEIANSLVITKTGIPVLEQIQLVITIHGGSNAGTYAAKELVYAYAMWISPSFHLIVIRAYDAMVNNSRAVALPQDFHSDLLTIAKAAQESAKATQASADAAQALANGILAFVNKYASPMPDVQIQNVPTSTHIVDCEQRNQSQLPSPTAPTLAATSKAQLCADATFLTILWEFKKSQPFTAGELYRIILTREYPALSDEAVELLGDVTTWTARKLGQSLGRWSRSEVNCYRVLNTDASKNGIVWRLERVS